MARPRKEIDERDFESLCTLQCTKEEICGFFDVSDKTLENWCKRTYSEGFSEVFKKKRGKGKISLRRAQFRLAEKSASMAIWLGKQWLGQKDTVEIERPDEVVISNNLVEVIKISAQNLKNREEQQENEDAV
ncbi:MAG: hypothetical protein SOR71_05160 [Oscillospiraceae bacterium]|nr:hypothetical protein [Oscillospiraceae bacterium]